MSRQKLDDQRLPKRMHTEEMHQAMTTLIAFSDKQRAYHQYQARQNYLRQQKSIENYLNTLRIETKQVQAKKEQAQAEKEAAIAEIALLKSLFSHQ